MKNNYIILISSILFGFYSQISFGSGKIYGKSQTLNKEYKKYETCRLKKSKSTLKMAKKMDINVYLEDN